jgi:phosphoglucomutase
MDRKILERAGVWTGEQFDEETRCEIQDLIDRGDEKELTERFYSDLEFGTGGMRGIMGPGTNRMNVYTVGRATQGLADYLLQNHADAAERGVAIAYDSRNNSTLFAHEAARVLAANGIRVYIFPELRPTPLLSFTVRHLQTRGGIVLTASHNPKEYNGYKVYADTGAQVTPPEDGRIVDYVNRVDFAKDVRRMDYQEGVKKGLIQEIDESVENVYLEKVKRFVERLEKGIQDILAKVGREIRVVYTPLHGAGVTLVPRALEAIKGAVVHNEKDQSVPDGNFTTTPSPNPEETAALSKAIGYAKSIGADIVIATDPDCDRMGLAVPEPGGDFITLNGNQIGVLLAYMVSSSYRSSGEMPVHPVIISTVVSTELTTDIVKTFGIELINVLTGFKFIGEKMHEFEQKGNRHFIYGFEESFGYLAGTFVRDKDGVIASVLATILVKYAIGAHGSVLAFLEHIYREYGMHMEYLKSFVLRGAEGVKKIAKLMESLRNRPPVEISGSRIKVIKDFLLQQEKHLDDGKVLPLTDLVKSNVLQFYTQDGVKVSARPSGTEPKIKFYFGLKAPFTGSIQETRKLLDEKYEQVSSGLFRMCDLI